MSSTEIALVGPEPEPQPSVDHIIDPRMLTALGLTANEYIEAMRTTSGIIIALCGHQWQASGALGYRPVCDACQNIVDNL